MKIAPHAALVLTALNQAGYEAWAVGGCVRDMQMGRVPSDWDVATSATPEAVKAALPWRTLDTGIAHGTVTALVEGQPVEITTYRIDGEYEDGRRPKHVAYTTSLEADLSRRDFTMNAVAVTEHTLFDPFGGLEDIRNKTIRAVGEPQKRFEEDALRILRALRFAAQLGFSIDPPTAAALVEKRHLLKRVSAERIATELVKLLEGPEAAGVLRQYAEVIAVFLPEIFPAMGFDQNNKHHIYDVWEHTLHAIAASPQDRYIRLCLLFHDLGKPHSYSVDSQGIGHFYGHGGISAQLCKEAMTRLRFDGETIRCVEALVRYHDVDLLPTEKSIRRWLGRLDERMLRRLIWVKRADNLAQAPQYRQQRQRSLDQTEEILKQVLESQAAFSLAQLAVNGVDMLALGLTGPKVGAALHTLLEDVIEGRCPNERLALLQRGTALAGEWGSEH